MITASMKIDRPSNVVWGYFTTVGNWGKWYGSGLKQVTPTWQLGANLVWETGGMSAINKFIPGAEIGMLGAGRETTFKFSRSSDSITIVEISEPDVDLGRKVELEGKLLKFKLRVEAETKK